MRLPWISRGAFWLAVATISACGAPREEVATDSTPAFILEDAERFAIVLEEAAGAPDATALQAGYLDSGTDGIEIFTPYRIIDAENLAAQIARQPEAYQKGIRLCLPAARSFAADAGAVMKQVAAFLGESETAPAYALFGGNNSGGTASAEGLVLGLEVLCRFVDDEAGARRIIEDFVAHEITHVYQHRVVDLTRQPTLLEAAIFEGFADFVMETVLGRPSLEGAGRAAYGEANEAALWRAFKADMEAGGEDYGDWLYKGALEDRPADLGYWIGKRISEAYHARAQNKPGALRDLLELADAPAILAASGYGEEFAERDHGEE